MQYSVVVILWGGVVGRKLGWWRNARVLQESRRNRVAKARVRDRQEFRFIADAARLWRTVITLYSK